MKDEPAIVVALSTVVIALLTSSGLALSDQVKLAIPVLIGGLVLPLLQGVITRALVYSPLSAQKLAASNPHLLGTKEI